MRELVHLTPADALRLPWKNGRGVSDELAIWPRGAQFEKGNFEWRISKAVINEPVAFSSFPGIDRVIVVTGGQYVTLSHSDSAPRTRVKRLEPYAFQGEWATSARLPKGPVSDFSVMSRRGAARADVLVPKFKDGRARATLLAGDAFLHVVAGSVAAQVTGEQAPAAGAAGESLWFRAVNHDDELLLTTGGDECVVLLVRIGPAEIL